MGVKGSNNFLLLSQHPATQPVVNNDAYIHLLK